LLCEDIVRISAELDVSDAPNTTKKKAAKAEEEKMDVDAIE